MTDFEQAAINAFKEVFGSNLTIRTCLFHLSQSIHRHIKRNGLSHIYSSNEDYRTLVRSLAALSFLPVRQVEPAFQLLLTEFWKLDLLSIAESVFHISSAVDTLIRVSMDAFAEGIRASDLSLLRNSSDHHYLVVSKWNFHSALFFTTTLLTSIGYGNLVPISPLDGSSASAMPS
uniref:Potassium channel domain-containing protein n=1 Tax=Ditylenchus dipsaci TaxID=166011 RepID=A0A915DX09_9BILA